MTQLFIDTFDSTTATGGTRVLDAQHDSATDGTAPNGSTEIGNMFFRTTLASDAVTGMQTIFTGFTGSYWRGEDVEDAGAGPTNPNLGQIDWTGINITGSTGLTVSGLFGSRDTFVSGTWTFETTDFITLSAQIDGGAYVTILSFRGTGVADEGMQQDSNLDGAITGADNGMTLTEALASYTANIAGTGATLNLRLLTNVGASEEIAFDDIQINDAAAGNAAPTTSGIEGAALSFTEHDPATAITSTIVLADADDTDLEGATITISAGYDAANDSLTFVNQNGITGVVVGNVLTLSGTSSIANYQAAIRSVTYDNAFTTESTTQRTISIVVDDGTDTSIAATRDIDFVIDEILTGTAGPDQLSGGFGADIVNGLGSNDRLFGGDGTDTLNGGDGNDQLWGMAGADALDGGAGEDGAYFLTAASGVTVNLAGVGSAGEAMGDTYTNIENVFGSDFDDQITGDGGANDLFGRGGNDRLFGQGGDDLLSAGDGNDELWGGAGADHMHGGAGIDGAYYITAPSGVNLSLLSGGSTGDAAGDTFRFVENVYGSDFADTIGGTNDANEIYGRDGADRLFGLDGDDLLSGGDGSDQLTGGLGADTLLGGAGQDAVYYITAASAVHLSLVLGGSLGEALGDTFGSIEVVYGSDFDDVIQGSSGNEELYGRDGNDLLLGGEGADLLNGGAGDDRLYGGEGADMLFGSSGIDTANYSYSSLGINVNLATGTATGGDAAGDTLVSIENIYASRFADTVTGDLRDNLINGLDGNDTIFGAAGNDRLIAGEGSDTLFGGDGDDTLIGIEGSNILNGEAGNDMIFGGSGQDMINGGIDDDILVGGGDTDRFIFSGDHGTDRITDFADGVERIEFNASSGVSDMADLTFTQVGAHVEIVSSAGTINVNNMLVADFSAADFVFAPPQPGAEKPGDLDLLVSESADSFTFGDIPIASVDTELGDMLAVATSDFGDYLSTLPGQQEDKLYVDAYDMLAIITPDDADFFGG